MRRARLATLTTTLLMLGAPLLVPSASNAATALPCRAHMSDSAPSQYTYDKVIVRTARRAFVVATAHYKTSTTSHHRRANLRGKAKIPFYISGATPGYRVHVTVTVHKHHHSNTCYTSFVPHR
jgi:hypothetical protein